MSDITKQQTVQMTSNKPQSTVNNQNSQDPQPVISNPNIAISVKNLSKKYQLYETPKHRLKEALHPFRKKYHHDFWAVKNISFEARRGETIGIIGRNGSGKSTLLQMICGTMMPTQGEVNVNGRVAALLELGAGFNPEFTGRENVYINAAIMGFSRKETDKRLDDILNFADIGDFIDQPVKTYSSGMYVRLAFAVAINVDPEILIVDEALSVGDMYFQHKCISKIMAFQAEGKTILLVTHDISLVKSFCKSVILLNDGKMVDYGEPEYVTEQYLMMTRQKEAEYVSHLFHLEQKTETDLPEAKVSFGSAVGKILGVRTLDKEFNETTAFLTGLMIIIRVQIQVDPKIKNPSISFILRDHRGYNIYGTSTARLGQRLTPYKNNQATVYFSLSPVLSPGSYSLTVSLDEYLTPEMNMLLDRQVGVGTFQVIGHIIEFFGTVDLHAEASQDLNLLKKKLD